MSNHAIELADNQKLIWLGQQKLPTVPLYEIPYRFCITGEIDHERFCKAFQHMVAANSVLRWAASDAKWSEPIVSPVGQPSTRFVDVASEMESEQGFATIEQQWVKRPLDYEKSLCDSLLVKVGTRDYRWLVKLHHAITDASNAARLLENLSDWYLHLGGERKAPKPTERTDHMPRGETAIASDWWEQRSEPVPASRIPNAGTGHQAYQHQRSIVELDADEVARIAELVTKAPFRQITEGMSQFVTLMSSLVLWSHLVEGQLEVPVGATIHGRDSIGKARALGMYARLFPFRINMARDSTVLDLVRSVVAETSGFLKYSSAPLTPRSQGAFHTALNLIEMDAREFAGMPASVEWLHNGYGDPGRQMTVSALRTNGVIRKLIFDFRTDTFDSHGQRDAVGWFRRCLEILSNNQEDRLIDLEFVSAAQKSLLDRSLGTAIAVGGNEIWNRFVSAAQSHEPRVAIQCEQTGSQWSYSELQQAAADLAAEVAMQRGDAIPVLCRRDAQAVLAFLAIVAAGKCFIPLDADDPVEKRNAALKDCSASCFLDATNNGLRWVPLDLGDRQGSASKLPDDSVYVLYTSGTTGRPNGVIVRGGAVLNLLDSFESLAPLSMAQCRCSWWTNVGFDVAIYELFSALLSGHALLIPDEATRVDARKFFDWMQARQINSVYLPAFWLDDWRQRLADDLAAGESLRRILVGVEPISQRLLGSLAKRLPYAALINGYGPTEATICATLKRIDSDQETDGPASIGRPVTGNQVRIVDEFGRQKPPGTVGELQISGAGLAHGYLDRPDLNRERFIKDAVTGERWYRTGDRVYLRHNGDLQFVGRDDNQLKIRGHRVELGEVASAIQDCDGVSDSAVVIRGSGDKRSLGALVVTSREFQSDAELRNAILKRLPGHLVPGEIHFVDAVPRKVNGKLDTVVIHQILDQAIDSHDAEPFRPNGASDWSVYLAWRKILDCDSLTKNANFFEYGGNSLSAHRLVLELDSLGVQATVADVFARPRLCDFAAMMCFAESTEGPVEIEPTIIPIEGELRQIWTACQLKSHSASYHIHARVEFPDALEFDRANQALLTIVERHELLRAVVVCDADGSPRFSIRPLQDAGFDTGILSRVPAVDLGDHAKRPFDLTQGPLIRASLVSAENHGCILALTVHHLIADEAALRVIVEDFVQQYEALGRGVEISAESPARTFAAYVSNRVARRQTESSGNADSYKNCESRLRLPGSAFGHQRNGEGNGSCVNSQISAELSAQLKQLARQHGVGITALFLAAFEMLLSRLTGTENFVVGVPISDREAQDRRTIGCYLRTMRFPCHGFSERTIAAKLRRVGGQFANCLQDERCFTNEYWEHPIQAMLVRESDAREIDLADGVKARMDLVDLGHPKFELSMFVRGNDTFEFGLEFGSQFSRRDADNYLQHWQQILTELVAEHESESPELWLTQDDREAHRLLAEPSAPILDSLNVLKAFENQVAIGPDSVAIEDSAGAMSYRELDLASSMFAAQLQSYDLHEGLVPVLCDRSSGTLVCILGILKTGAGYVPLNPSQSVSRLLEICKQVRSDLVVSATGASELESAGIHIVCWEPKSGAPIDRMAFSHDLAKESTAYVMFTSGSTGQPQGVVVSHRALAESTAARCSFYRRAPEKFLLVSPFWFDSSVAGLFWTLSTGGTLVIPSEQEIQDMGALAATVRHYAATDVLCLPSLLDLLLQHADLNALDSLRRIVVAGESLHRSTVDRCERSLPKARLFNEYGPTEASVWCSATELGSDSADVTIGRSVPGTKLHLLDRELRPVPLGVVGQVCVSGSRLADGYLDNPTRTREKFVEFFDNDKSCTLYLTGDMAFLRADGKLVFQGRQDRQIKVNGQRIELGEIEAELTNIEGVEAAVVESTVLPAESESGRSVLIAWVECSLPHISSQSIREALRGRLSASVVPHTVRVLDQLPRNDNGKLDRVRLRQLALDIEPAPDKARASNLVEGKPSASEAMLCEICRQILGDAVDSSLSFSDLGGDSFSSIRFTALARAQGFEIEPADVLGPLTIRELSEKTGSALPHDSNAGLTANSRRCCVKEIRKGSGIGSILYAHEIGGSCSYAQHIADKLDSGYTQLVTEQVSDGIDDDRMTIVELASHYVEQWIERDPMGPHFVIGYCWGGMLGYEICQQMRERGHVVTAMGVIDFGTESVYQHASPIQRSCDWTRGMILRVRKRLRGLGKDESIGRLIRSVTRKMLRLIRRAPPVEGEFKFAEDAGDLQVIQDNLSSFFDYEISPSFQPIHLFRSKNPTLIGTRYRELSYGWKYLVGTAVQVRWIEGDHNSCVLPPHVDGLASQLNACLFAGEGN